jgi:hypothetical protein
MPNSCRLSLVLHQLVCACIILLSACSGDVRAEADASCRAGIQSGLPRFLNSGDIIGDNQLFSLLSKCGDQTDLSAVLEALTQPNPQREALETEGAVEAVLRSPALAHNPTATQAIVNHFGIVRHPGARQSLSYLLGSRDEVQALNSILRDDPASEVRRAAAVSLHNCKTLPDFAPLWRAAKLDPDRPVRAQAYLTLHHFGQLRSADEFLAASRAQTDPTSTGLFLGNWLRVNKVSEKETAETLTGLAEHTGSSEASGALALIFTSLQVPQESLFAMVAAPPEPLLPLPSSTGAPFAPIRSLPIPVVKPHENQLQRALYLRRERISHAALAQFAASKDMREESARTAIDCALTINRCDPSGCARLPEILRVTDRMPPPLALEASHDISSKIGSLYFTRRRRQYALALSLAFLVTLMALMVGFARTRRRLFAIGAGWLLILAPTAALQFASGPITGVSVWPPPLLWPATALGSVGVTLLVTVAATLIWGPKWLVPRALILGELGWWVVPTLLTAGGLTLKMQHYSRDEDWLPFMLAIAMMVGAPLLTLALSVAAWRLQRTVLDEGD